MDVILIRHAEAGDRDPVKYPDDDVRPVTPDGRRKMASVARAMKKMGIGFDHLLSSPLLRAVQTAEIIGDAFGFRGELEISATLGHGCTAAGVTRMLAKYPPDSRVALVGHEPDLSAVAAAMIGAEDTARIELKKGGSIGIAFEEGAHLGKGMQQYHLRPSHLRKLKR